MLKPEQVPDVVVECAVSTWLNTEGTVRQDITKVIAAAINAWPGMGRFEDETGWDVHIELPLLVPLNTEPRDE